MNIKKVIPYIILTSASLLFFLKINSYPLKNWDEAWYGEVSRNMASGKFGHLMPYWNGNYFFDKPPLYFWLSAPFYKFFGSGEWQARIVSELAASGSILFIYLIGQRLFSRKVGIYSALIFVTFGQVVRRFSEGNLDALFIFSILGSFYFFLKSEKRLVYSILSGIFAAMAILTKGWVFGLFPLFIITLYSFLFRRLRFKNYCPVPIACILTAGWWYVLGTIHFGQKFFDWYIFSPAAGGLKNPLLNFSLTYFGYFARDVGIWLVFMTLVFFNRFKEYKKYSIFFLITIITLLFSLSFLSEKFDWYTLLVYPFAAILAALGFESLFSGKDAPCKARCILNESFRMSLRGLKGRSNLMYSAFGLLLFVNFALTSYFHSFIKDKSYISADLGKSVGKIVPKGDTVYLESNDFPAFLYYSKLEKIYVVSDKTPRPEEWWIISKNNTLKRLQKYGGWLITQNTNFTPGLNLPKCRKFRLPYEYYLIEHGC